MTTKGLFALSLAILTLASCGQQPSAASKSNAAAMPTPTVSGTSAEMPAGTQMAALSMINAKIKKPTAGRPTSGYLIIENGGPTPETITAVSSPDFGRVELSDHVMKDGLDSMVKLDTLEVPGNGQLAFVPGGKHLMLFDPKKPLNNGDSTKVTLTFSNSGPIETNFVVLETIPPSTGGTTDPMAGHDMSGHDKSGAAKK
jgi:periplasmic copper chaperone A